MKKLATSFLCLFMLFLSVPISANAASSDTEVISTHGSKTYMGTAYDWSETWDSDNFTDVTGEDVDSSDDLIIKGGTIGDVTVGDSSDLTITGGSMSDVYCDGDIEMSAGKADSLESSDDIDISGGSVKGDIDADQDVTLAGKLTLNGNVSAANVTVDAANTNGSSTVSGDVIFTEKMIIEGSNYFISEIDGQSSGTLDFEGSSVTLPKITDVEAITLDSDSMVSTHSSLDIDSLSISSDSRFTGYSTLTVGTISGPGILVFNAGALTVNTAISDSPIFDFNGTASIGTTLFKAESGAALPSDVTIFGYGLTEGTYSSSYDSFTLSPPTGDGVTLSSSSLAVTNGGSATVTATITSPLSELSIGSQLCWKLIDPSSTFTITPNISNNTCSVSSSGSSDTSAYKATLAAYLADSDGYILSDYKTALCTLSSTPSSGMFLDTKAVTIPIGHKYSVLAITSAQTPPGQTSYNSTIAVIGKATAYSYNGKTGWLYPITAKAKGGVTINIGGQNVLVTVA